ncbi:hypothetical protein CEXT_752341 [Caerostris extrusa]|uniref:Uncharacterized protein n=1 Tax=Caerostris extrusa TaxID=172846 RepID=A0AAV4SC99_CAEEX|nr:hypothetical protein CEXT_752341 [Caerostris extrusa]
MYIRFSVNLDTQLGDLLNDTQIFHDSFERAYPKMAAGVKVFLNLNEVAVRRTVRFMDAEREWIWYDIGTMNHLRTFPIQMIFTCTTTSLRHQGHYLQETTPRN